MKALVTGGGGFLGRAVALELRAAGHEVTSASRSRYPELETHGVRTVSMDLEDARQVSAAIAGHDTVFHVAAKTGVWGPREAFFRANTLGTRHVLAGCRAQGVAKLVFTSSPSVCFDGRDHVNASNDLPYPETFLSPYPETKALAEREVLAANGGELATCALRPHLIVGEGDPHLVPRLLDRARRGKLAIVGDGHNEVSLTYVGNAARAHRLAAERLEPGAAHAGRAYFLGQEEPVRLWTWIHELLADLDLPPVTRRVSLGTATRVGAALEVLWRALGLGGEPPMTRFIAAQLATSHSYDLAPAKRDFGYSEEVDLREATRRIVAHYRDAS